MSRQWWGSLRSTHPTRLCFRSSPACGRSGGPSPSDQLSAFSFQLCPASSCPGNRPPGAVYSLMYVCALLLFDNSTDIRRTLPGVSSMRRVPLLACPAVLRTALWSKRSLGAFGPGLVPYDSQSCTHPALLDKPAVAFGPGLVPYDSQSCTHPALLDKPAVAPGTRHCWTSRQWHPAAGTAGQASSATRRAVPAKGARCLFWADLTEPCRGPRRFLRHKTLYRKYLQRPIFSFCINHCRIMVYIQLCPLTAAAYFGGNAIRKALLNNDLRHTHPHQWLFFGPKKPRRNSEGAL